MSLVAIAHEPMYNCHHLNMSYRARPIDLWNKHSDWNIQYGNIEHWAAKCSFRPYLQIGLTILKEKALNIIVETTVVYKLGYPITLPVSGLDQQSRLNARCSPILNPSVYYEHLITQFENHIVMCMLIMNLLVFLEVFYARARKNVRWTLTFIQYS